MVSFAVVVRVGPCSSTYSTTLHASVPIHSGPYIWYLSSVVVKIFVASNYAALNYFALQLSKRSWSSSVAVNLMMDGLIFFDKNQNSMRDDSPFCFPSTFYIICKLSTCVTTSSLHLQYMQHVAYSSLHRCSVLRVPPQFNKWQSWRIETVIFSFNSQVKYHNEGGALCCIVHLLVQLCNRRYILWNSWIQNAESTNDKQPTSSSTNSMMGKKWMCEDFAFCIVLMK